jgi:biopolymer transport protein ExbD
MRTPRHPRSAIGLNMTPMIDVVFQLLIFFVCTVEFQRQEELLRTQLPPVTQQGTAAVRTPEEQDLGRIAVDVTAEALVARFQGRSRHLPNVNGEVPLGALLQQLRDWTRLEPRVPVRIACSPDVPTGTLLQVYDACVQTGLQDVGIVDRP